MPAMGRRTHSAEAAWTPRIAHRVRHELMDDVHEQRRKAYRRLDELEAEASLLAEDLNDADEGSLHLDPDEYADREAVLEKADGLLSLINWWSSSLAVTVLNLADAPVHWVTAPAVELITGVRNEEATAGGGGVDTRVLPTLGSAGLALFERSAGRHRPSKRCPGLDNRDVGIDGLCWWRATLGGENSPPPVVDMITLHVLTRDRKLCRSAVVDGRRPAVVDVDAFTVAVEPAWTGSAQASPSVRVLMRLADDLVRGTLTASPVPTTGRTSAAVAVVA